MAIQAVNINSLWAYLIIEELIRNNIHYFCISPGSRSTPLIIAAANNQIAKKIICYDERSAAFHALGYSRATNSPAVLISTSGTAVANYFPAIIEAHQDRIPLIILSADRPPELRETGSNQTIDQVKIFGNYVRWHIDLPCPDEHIPAQMPLTTIDQAIMQARLKPSGPVHINCMFREPLEPKKNPVAENYINKIKTWEKKETVYTKYQIPVCMPQTIEVENIVKIINTCKSGILVLGPLQTIQEKRTAFQLANKLNWPIFADILSGLKAYSSQSTVVNYYDQLLFSESFKKLITSGTILHIGGQFTSKRLLQFFETCRPQRYIVIKDHPFREDPLHLVTDRISGDIEHICKTMIPLLKEAQDLNLVKKLKSYDKNASSLLEDFMQTERGISEISVSIMISSNIPEDHGLFLANSMPIRDMDMYAEFNSSPFYISANRGASGIDGNIATALGYAQGLQKSMTILLGDLAVIHDLNSLTLISEIELSLILIVINNGGGGIFSFLPIAQYDQYFEPYFGTPHTYKFKYAAQMFNISYYHPKTNQEFLNTYKSVIKNHEKAIIEIKTDRSQNQILHHELQQKIMANL
jgi:2-succinyl-5-enolpyruvyl-6-hydroxy-3-cyclohexene-1-carboxylate synthase